jgi:recombination protein RecA
MSFDALAKKYKDYIDSANIERPKSMFSLGPMSLNFAVGNPEGVPSGRVVQIVGRQSSGKSTLSLDIIRAHQAKYPEEIVVYVDFERSFDRDYAKACGVNLDRLFIVRAKSTEQGLSIAEESVDRAGVRLVLIDSIAAAVPSAEFDKGYDDSPKVAGNAGLITRFVSRMVHKLDDRDALLVILNQLRMNFNTMSPEKEVPFGGMALQYATSVTVALNNMKKEDTEQTIQAFIRKNKVGAPQSRCQFIISYGNGIDHARDIIELGVHYGLVIKSGSWFSFGEHKAQGAAKAATIFPLDNLRDLVVQCWYAEKAKETHS